MKLTKKIIALIEQKTSCSVSEWKDKKGYNIYVDNTCDEDYEIEVERSDHAVEDIIMACNCYDSDEHFRCWFGANNGEPTNARDLLDNCEEIGKHLTELADLLRGL